MTSSSRIATLAILLALSAVPRPAAADTDLCPGLKTKLSELTSGFSILKETRASFVRTRDEDHFNWLAALDRAENATGLDKARYSNLARTYQEHYDSMQAQVAHYDDAASRLQLHIDTIQQMIKVLDCDQSAASPAPPAPSPAADNPTAPTTSSSANQGAAAGAQAGQNSGGGDGNQGAAAGAALGAAAGAPATQSNAGGDNGGGGQQPGDQGGGQQTTSNQGNGFLGPLCLMQKQGPDGIPELKLIRCDNVAGAGPGWTPLATNLASTLSGATGIGLGNPLAATDVGTQAAGGGANRNTGTAGTGANGSTDTASTVVNGNTGAAGASSGGAATPTSTGTNIICGYTAPTASGSFTQDFGVAATVCPSTWCLNNNGTPPIDPGHGAAVDSSAQCNPNQTQGHFFAAWDQAMNSLPSAYPASVPPPTQAANTSGACSTPTQTKQLLCHYDNGASRAQGADGKCPTVCTTGWATGADPATGATLATIYSGNCPKGSGVSSVDLVYYGCADSSVSSASAAATPQPPSAAIRLRSSGPPAPCAAPLASAAASAAVPLASTPIPPLVLRSSAGTNSGTSSTSGPMGHPCNSNTNSGTSQASQPNTKAASLPQSGQQTSSPRSQTSASQSQTTTSRSSSSGRSLGGQAQSSNRGSSGFASNGAGHSGFGSGGGLGGGGGGFGRGGGLSGGSGGGHRSDIRLKEDIVPLGRLDNGIGLYRFRYRGDDHTAYVGVMAQEVQALVPEAVSRGRDGYLRVDYDRLGLEFLTWDEWLARGGTRSETIQ
jgi:hypothetical protein